MGNSERRKICARTSNHLRGIEQQHCYMLISPKDSSCQCAMPAAHIDELASRRKVERRYDSFALLSSHLLHRRVEQICCVCVGTQKAEQVHPMRLVKCGFPVVHRIEKTAPRVPPPALPVHDGGI